MYSHFVIPFVFGVIFLFGVVTYKYASWFYALSSDNKKIVWRSIFSLKSLSAVWEIIKESLLHVSIFKHNLLLGYMHASLAFGWFLLIAVGSVEVAQVIGHRTPLYVHIFFKYFHPTSTTPQEIMFANIMDGLLLFVLFGVFLALAKRYVGSLMGMRKRSQHSLGDRVALFTLWLIFPLRFLAESITSGLYGSGGFATGRVGELLSELPFLSYLELPAWWAYSIVLALFFISMPFSRYMHIFTEIPHIFLRKWGVKPSHKACKSDNFQIHACSRCGMCIDTCQMQSVLDNNKIQAVYFLRKRRAGLKSVEAADNCLMCGRCEHRCPVNLDIDTLRLSSRHKLRGGEISYGRYNFINKESIDINQSNRVGYFAGCMTHLTPATIKSMKRIFEKVGDDMWFADEDKGVCCGRPLKLTGEVEAANRMIEYNRELFIKSGIKLLVTSCPICLRTFKNDYKLAEHGIDVIHHSQYIAMKIESGALKTSISIDKIVAYHDPCELGRGLDIYDEPRQVISSFATLKEMKHNRADAMCCGRSLANTKLLHNDKELISNSAIDNVDCDTLITSCPQCKSAFIANKRGIKVKDISELVSECI